ncbi:MmgE/PrpD family protein [Metabacillus arenae]|uniref:MmgE/PrpD family protein n=1 Tax=Metabacillus arenae TaxID=2771434 RepID=A0A926NCL2_9BACI|nr:MmgE/PrpD family protein [Metabacillus arenae]MBD1381787.1 MmgE/PrpD family protein [Metabacillus arenae]
MFVNRLCEFCASTEYEDLPAQVIENTKNAIIDTHGVIFTGYKEPVADLLIDWVKDQSMKTSATILGYELKTSESLAALVNGVMGHAIDFDDVHSGLRGHPSIPIYSAILAVAEAEKKTGKELITAFSVGVEIMTKLGSYVNPSHVVKGWHPTATLGVIGVASAIGKLYSFTQAEFKQVFGLATSMMSGLKLNFGTMTKPFHIGYCAKNGIEAAQLVKRGFTACEDTFTPKTGVFDLFTDEEVKEFWGEDLGKPWSLIDPGFNVKRYPCCYATHRFADAALILSQTNQFKLEDIERIECVAAVGSYVPLIYNRPKSGVEGKFSLEYVIAAMLQDQKLSVQSFTDEMVNRAVIQELLKKVFLSEDETIKENRPVGDIGYIELIIHTNEKAYKETIFHAKGSSKQPLSQTDLKEKFFDCLSREEFTSEANTSYQQLRDLENISDITQLFPFSVTKEE